MSCNGCRVLRKGCSESCILRPCLQWIESADAQGHATVFVAKFFGRAGLMGFISAVPEYQRAGIYLSTLSCLLYSFAHCTYIHTHPISLFTAVPMLQEASYSSVLTSCSLRDVMPDDDNVHADVESYGCFCGLGIFLQLCSSLCSMKHVEEL